MRAVLLICLAMPAWAQEPGAYALYRSNPKDRLASEHVARFDSKQGAEANSENCWAVAELFQDRSEENRRFWCRPVAAQATEAD